MSGGETGLVALRQNGLTNGVRKVALITGITGQDGSYLAELLLSKGYEVHGIIRRSSSFNTGRIAHLYADPQGHREGKMKLHYGDMTDSSCLVKIIVQVRPNEIYNLAAQSHVKVSFDMSEYTAEVDAVGTLRILDAIRTCGMEKEIRFYQASTSELYGKVQETPQKETTPFYPRSPYACAKLYGYWIVTNYREAYGMFACNGILFNHESPRRGENFVTRKITRSVAKIHLGQIQSFELGNLDAMRDWGHAQDYVEAMWLMLQQEKPEDFVIATGKAHSVREFVEESFKIVGREIVWEGKGVEEVGKDKETGIVRVKVNPKYYRPTEVEFLLGDATKAKKALGWEPKVQFFIVGRGSNAGNNRSDWIIIFKEEERLSATILKMMEECAVVPRAGLIKSAQGIVFENKMFEGLTKEDGVQLQNYYHVRKPVNPWDKNIVCRSDYNLSLDFLDSVAHDFPAGCWSIQVDKMETFVTLRTMYWPGFLGFHQLGTQRFGWMFLGTGKKNWDVPFMMTVAVSNDDDNDAIEGGGGDFEMEKMKGDPNGETEIDMVDAEDELQE